jgi:nitric oxide reductase large subunit
LLKPNRWHAKVVRISFWSINAGLMLMVVLDLFPAGVIQFKTIVEQGLWYARSEAFIQGGVFESLTWLRGIGATVFFLGGVVPLTWFIVSRANSLKSATDQVEDLE